ncbi:MAG: signal transduction protein [Candidatus Nephthysia bennettiae]|uniref:CBS domain-containing protein n=1 Tax=Candidatus Nephthysia bennettiae TaxID=3127016 RepID=A0A934NAC8_9BACT|nr:CBS domain-containing protein [Candidatus Dormibacteraeota bacterium]PZR95083.1 MAG: signal transduction protein [Candidatus Dormibacteraeota bacterium]
MRVKDLPTKPLLALGEQASLAEVAGRMRAEDQDSVAIMADNRLLGVITERDLVRAIAAGVDTTQASAGLFMSADLVTTKPDEDVAVAATRMIELGIRHLPVIDEEGLPIGLLSAHDLLAVMDRNSAFPK